MKLYSLALLLPLFLFYSDLLNAQADITISRKDFQTVKEGFTTAWDHIKAGDNFYKRGGVWYKNAYEEYLKAYNYNGENAELNYKIGASALCSDNKHEASRYLLRAYELNANVAEDILLLSGRALQFAGRYNEAIDKLEAYISGTDKRDKTSIELANRYITECKMADQISKDTLRIKITNTGAGINSEFDDYSIVFSSNGKRMYFGSRRALNQNNSKRYEDNKYDENIFLSDMMGNEWSVAAPAGKNLNTGFCEVPLFLNKSEDRLFIYAGYEGNGDIMVSVLKKGVWKPPVKEQLGISSFLPETSMCISPDGGEVAFIRNTGKKGNGGKDIFIMKKINERKWSKPRNAGITINSKYDEESVSYSKGGDTLWFSSEGHNTMGGFDIFYSIRSTDGSWGPPVNAGYPINTPWHELFYVPAPDTDSAFYFTSDRSGGFGGLDIYRGEILPPPLPVQPTLEPEQIKPPEPQIVTIRDTVVIIKEYVPIPQPSEKSIYITGRISDSETGEAVAANIEIIDFSTDSIVTIVASSPIDGNYRIKLPEKKTYIVNIRATGFLSDMKKITIGPDFNQDFLQLDVPLIKVKVGKKIVLNNIFFELGKAVLTKDSFEELDKLVAIMNENPGMKIEISGHTDNTGSAVINARLSTERAKAVVNYLIEKGIDPSRMKYMGYGSEQPIADNSTAEGRAKNRRVEFKILEM
ncbi:MAG TPA: OmpA family protein [Bacteroidales bacterium]|nr:OmpA family protein [Bacteroidales bacterium]